ncbi:hypothetical protein C6N75_00595 [Streptomyces solincola]|uniref:Uncharacterized protein n=1 Tax=Streptomyces solincola TaxID=2100817 RepID=A0A2S9Q392_9ACTN|nr:hypothetical protein [Streptomyces solincola]PRH81077.1 hypothetical protein C6N75_00595 [Streptomyces solincola]
MTGLTPMERRPAPVDNAVKAGVPHGAPVLRGGELAALYRDASFYSRPDTRYVKAVHVAVFSTRLTTNAGGQLGELAAACDPSGIMLCDDLFLDAYDVKTAARCRRRACQALFAVAERQHGDLDHIRSYYKLEHRIGVRVDLGLRVRHEGRPGAIIDTRGQYLVVRLDDETVPVTVHATSGMEYQGKDGWVRAVPLPDPYAAV